jgi:hypothetical protein
MFLPDATPRPEPGLCAFLSNSSFQLIILSFLKSSSLPFGHLRFDLLALRRSSGLKDDILVYSIACTRGIHPVHLKYSYVAIFCFQMQQLFPSTPLTGRRYLKSKELQRNVTPVSTATQSVSRLQTLLAGRQASPSETLLELFRYVLHINNWEHTYAHVKVVPVLN